MDQSVAADDYKASGYGAIEVGFGQRPAILVIDFQSSHVSPEFPFGGRPLAVRALENTLALMAKARELDIPVAACYTAYTSEKDVPYWKIETVRRNYFHGDATTILDQRVAEAGCDLIVCKSGPSMFYETTIQPFLTKQRVDTVILTGVNTSGCIRATAIDSFQRGYRTIVPEDCVGDVEEGPHIANLRDIERRYVDVVDRKRVETYFDVLRTRNDRT